MLLARLGLRSIEVARLELEDLDWRAGELVVRGKTRRQDRSPLPTMSGSWRCTG
jgi:integrase